jgi:ketosteroid isomerase-like protein
VAQQAPAEIVQRYLDGVVRCDWDLVGACVADDVVRVGPFGDTYSGRAEYLAFLSGLMPTLREYSMTLERVETAGTLAVAQLSESMTIGGKRIVTPESLVFDFDTSGRISRIAIYIQRLEGS